MSGSSRKFGYIRYIKGQKINLSILKKHNVDDELIFFEDVNLNDKRRPELDNLILEMKKGDYLYTENFIQLGNNMEFLINTINKVVSKHGSLVFLKEDLVFSFELSMKAKFALDFLVTLVNFDKYIRKERQLYGIEQAKSKGKFTGRKNVLTNEEIERLKELYNNGIQGTTLANMFKISRPTLYRYIRKKQ